MRRRPENCTHFNIDIPRSSDPTPYILLPLMLEDLLTYFTAFSDLPDIFLIYLFL